MSSWKRAAKAGQKTHRERHQPEYRKHLGLLEKKNDYILRAKDFQKKRETVKLLKKRALNKNPDEFYFHMINSRIVDSVHREKDKPKIYTPDQMKLMETQDLKYIGHKRNIEARKIEKLQSQLHMIDAANETANQHVFFLDEGQEMKNFNVAKKLDTHPALVGRRTNRPKLSELQCMKLPNLDEATVAKIEQQKHMAYTELRKRTERERELSIVERTLEIKNALKDTSTSPASIINPGSKHLPPICKWKFQRKK